MRKYVGIKRLERVDDAAREEPAAQRRDADDLEVGRALPVLAPAPLGAPSARRGGVALAHVDDRCALATPQKAALGDDVVRLRDDVHMPRC